jgi:Ca2+:H+ antiporter
MSKISSNKALLIAVILAPIFFITCHHIESQIFNVFAFSVLFISIISIAMNVAHHAEALAEKFGEPFGTLILTISAITVEVIIIVIVMLKTGDPTFARDSVYSAVILDINGILGISAIIGGLKYGEQKYNIDSSNSYMAMIMVAITVGMILPYFVKPEFIHSYYVFVAAMFILMYIVFTRIQTKEHRYFFEYEHETDEHHSEEINVSYHSFILVSAIVMIGVMSELLSDFMTGALSYSGLPITLGAIVVAVISASPELLTALRSARKNNMQTVVNIALGASLATVLLTIPSVLIASMIAGVPIDIKLSYLQITMLCATMLASIVIFGDGETNALEGFSYFVIFATFVFFAFV